MRGYVENHSVDMKMHFKFVDRGGRYVYEIQTASSRKVLGYVRTDWEKGTMVCDLIPPAPADEKKEKKMDPRQLDIPFPDNEGCTHMWQVVDPASNKLTCQRCGAEKPYRAQVACDHSFRWSDEDGVEVCDYCKEVRV